MSAKNPYESLGNQKQTLNSVVVFADVLGFKDMMKEAYRVGDPIALLNEFSDCISSAHLGLQGLIKKPFDHDEESPKLWEFKAFTDNVVIGFPIANDGEHEMHLILERLAIFQLMMIQKGFFVRGGVAVGEHYMDTNIVFGRALIEAHEAEAELARDPRIVLAPSAVRNFKLHLGYYSKAAYSWHYNVVLKDSDGQLFLNYLDMTGPYDESGNEVFLDSIRQHKEIVVEKLKRFADDPYIRSKYAWVANYHNFFCDQYSLESTLKIESELLEITPQRIDDAFAKAAIKS